jgi:hypothetical protein
MLLWCNSNSAKLVNETDERDQSLQARSLKQQQHHRQLYYVHFLSLSAILFGELELLLCRLPREKSVLEEETPAMATRLTRETMTAADAIGMTKDDGDAEAEAKTLLAPGGQCPGSGGCIIQCRTGGKQSMWL